MQKMQNRQPAPPPSLTPSAERAHTPATRGTSPLPSAPVSTSGGGVKKKKPKKKKWERETQSPDRYQRVSPSSVFCEHLCVTMCTQSINRFESLGILPNSNVLHVSCNLVYQFNWGPRDQFEVCSPRHCRGDQMLSGFVIRPSTLKVVCAFNPLWLYDLLLNS